MDPLNPAERAIVDALGEEPPAALRRRVLDLAGSRRVPGRPPGYSPISHAEALQRAVDDFDNTLARLKPPDWLAPTVYPEWRVRDLVGHVLAVEAYTASLLGGDPFAVPDGLDGDHLAMTLPTVEQVAGLSPHELHARWLRRALSLVALVRDPSVSERSVVFHGIPMSASTVVVVRVFELWTHADDIRRATGARPSAPDAGRLGLMTEVAVKAVPLGLLVAGHSGSGHTARIVLTGAGGGSWVQPLGFGEEAGPVDVTIVADSVEFCRMAAKRLDPGALPVVVEGDEDLAARVLTGAAVFAA